MLKEMKYNEYSEQDVRIHTDKHHHEDHESYFTPLWEMHHAYLHGSGVVAGLEANLTSDRNAIGVKQGIAVSKTGQLIALTNRGAVTKLKPTKENDLTSTPLMLVIGENSLQPDDDYRVTIEQTEMVISPSDSCGKQDKLKQYELIAWVRLQTVAEIANNKNNVVILATVTKDEQGKVILTSEERTLLSPSVGALHIQRASSTNDPVSNEPAGTISPSPNGEGLFTQLLTTDTIHSKNFFGVSDARLKTNVTPLTNVLARLERLRGVSFEWQAERTAATTTPPQPQIGVIAQEVEQVFPELVATSGADAYKGVDYSKLSALLLEGVKELKTANDRLQQENQTLAARLSALEARLTAGSVA